MIKYAIIPNTAAISTQKLLDRFFDFATATHLNAKYKLIRNTIPSITGIDSPDSVKLTHSRNIISMMMHL
jgi:hypothetical protein